MARPGGRGARAGRSGAGTTCTAAEKQAAQAAVAAYQKKIPKERAAYFKKHKKAAQRKAFVKKQQAKLKRLRHGGCLRRPAARAPASSTRHDGSEAPFSQRRHVDA